MCDNNKSYFKYLERKLTCVYLYVFIYQIFSLSRNKQILYCTGWKSAINRISHLD